MSRVLVVVLSYNKRARLLECLESLERQHWSDCHVLVADNGSTDGSAEAVRTRFPSAELLCNAENLGPGRGRNRAVSHADAHHAFDDILFLDDDAEVGPEAVGRLVGALAAHPGTAIVCGKTFVARDSDVLMSTGIVMRPWLGYCLDRGAGEQDVGQHDGDGMVDACGSFAMMIRREAFEQLGGFDAVFASYGWEDVDLCLRARAAGHDTRYVSSAEFVHKGTRLGRGPLAAYERHKVENLFVLLSRHLTPTQKLAALVTVPLRGLLLFARFARQGRFEVIRAQLRGLGDFSFGRRSGEGP